MTAAGWDLFDVARAGSMKPGNAALMPMAEGFLRWNAIDIPTAWAAAVLDTHSTSLRYETKIVKATRHISFLRGTAVPFAA